MYSTLLLKSSVSQRVQPLMAVTQNERNSFANVVEPTGWPSGRKPVVSSTSSTGADFLVG